MDQPAKRTEEGFRHVWIAQTSATVLGATFWLVLAFLLHPVAYGHIAWLVSIATVVSALCGLGLGTMIATYHPREHSERLLSTSVLVTLVSGIAGGIVTGAALSMSVDRSLAALVGLLVVALSMFSIAFYSELANRAYRRYMWVWIGVRTAALVLPLVFYSVWGSTPALLAGIAAAYFIFGTWALRHLNRGVSFAQLRSKTGFSLKAWGSGLAGVSLGFLDKILIGALFPLGMLAVYQFSFRIFLLLAVVPNALFFYMLPERSGGGEVRKLERTGIFLSIGLALAVFLIAPVIASNVFPGFREGIDTIRIMGLGLIPATLARIRSSQLYAVEKASIVLWSSLFGLAVSTSGIVITFSQGFGLTALAASMLAGQLGLMGGLLVLPALLKTGRTRRIGLGFLGVIVASALMFSALSLVHPRITVDDGRVIGRHRAMDTWVTIQVVADGREAIREARAAINAACAEIDRVEQLMSATDTGSQIYRLNNSGTRWVEMSPEVLYVLNRAHEHSILTDGAFDVTVEPLVDFWMEEVKRSGRVPTDEQLSVILELVNFADLIIDEENSRARFDREGMAVTLGGIAKGYAVDRACQVLLDAGIEYALVDIGGDMRAIGEKQWRIGIADPRAEGKLLGVIELQDGAVATSGDYQRYHLIGAERVHHIIDPRTGEPARLSMSVTVIAADSLSADALSTGIFVMGPDEGKPLLDAIGVAGLMVDPEGVMTTSECWGYDLSG